MQLSDIHPGAEIEYWCRKNKRAHHIRTGTVKQVTPRMIAVQGQKYPDTILVNDLLSGQTAIVKITQEGENDMGRRELDWEVLVPKILELEAEGKSHLDIAKELDIAISTVKRKIKEVKTAKEQTPTPAPETVGSLAPVDEGSAESASPIIPESEPVKIPKECPSYSAGLTHTRNISPFADTGNKILVKAWEKVTAVKRDQVALALMKELIEQGAV